MTDLTVAHLTVRQTDIHAGSAQLRDSALGKQAVQIRSFCCVDGIAHVAVAQSVAVHDNEY